jgi:hypothetical protein
MNRFEIRARRAKVTALCRLIDGCSLRLGCSPANGAADILTMLCGWTDAHWALAAKRAGVLTPSDKTIAAVINAYRMRITRAA